MGWIGEGKQVEYYLATVNADRGEDGRFIIGGAPVTVGLGGMEVVVPDETVYYIEGKPLRLALGLSGTSMGMPVKVFDRGPGYRANPSWFDQVEEASQAWSSLEVWDEDADGTVELSVEIECKHELGDDGERIEKALTKAAQKMLSDAMASRHEGQERFRGRGWGRYRKPRWTSEMQAEGWDKTLYLSLDVAPPNSDGDARAMLYALGQLDRGLEELKAAVCPKHKELRQARKRRAAAKRRKNPMATGAELVKKIQSWLKKKRMASESIMFRSTGEWNHEHGDWKGRVNSGFVIIAEGTWFNECLAQGYDSSSACRERYESFSELMRKNGWAWYPITGWAIHVYPTADEIVGEDGTRRGNPSRARHREAFGEYARSAVFNLQKARAELAEGRKGPAWNSIRSAECDLRQAYTEANYAHTSDPDLQRMAGRLERVYREVREVMAELRNRRKNPSTGDHVVQLGDAMAEADRQIQVATAALDSLDYETAARAGGDADTASTIAVLQATYLIPHAGEWVETGTHRYRIPSAAKLQENLELAEEIGRVGEAIRFRAMCEKQREPTKKKASKKRPRKRAKKPGHLRLVKGDQDS